MSTKHLVNRSKSLAVPIHPVGKDNLKKWLKDQPKALQTWVKHSGFEAEPGTFCLVAGDDGSLERVLAGVGNGQGMWAWAPLPNALPKGRYEIEADMSPAEAEAAAMGWALGTYEFTRYRKPKNEPSSLVWPEGVDKKRVGALVEGIFLARDLINTPAEDMGPPDIAAEARKLAKKHGARVSVTKGDKLLDNDWPTVHAVGRASSRPPHVVDLKWGKPKAPKLTLVGKGITFDSGGLDLKPASGMLLMKKDMGGAATVLGLAHAIMATKQPVRLRVLIPTADNAVSGNAFRPLDVLTTRKGLTVEVGNTDAEGRLVMCDALAAADSEDPDLIVDVATLTGAARVALGTELPALFSTDDEASAQLLAAGVDVNDRLWRMPLHDDYRRLLDSTVADISNVASGRFGGAITAALFLREFVSKNRAWMHIDTMAWNLENRPGRPVGGEVFGLRALYAMVERRYGGT